MNNFTFYSPTEFVFGKETDNNVGSLCRRYGAKRVLVVYGGQSAKKSGLLDRVFASLEAEGLTFAELGGIQPNPTDGKVYEGIELVRKENADFVLAVGGGSVIDTAKAICAGVPYDGDFWTSSSARQPSGRHSQWLSCSQSRQQARKAQAMLSSHVRQRCRSSA